MFRGLFACLGPLRVGVVLRALRHGGQPDQDTQQAPVLQLAAQLARQRVGVALLAVQLHEQALAQRCRQPAPVRQTAGYESKLRCQASGFLSSHTGVFLGTP